MRILIIILVVVIIPLQAYGLTIEGGVKYDVNSARQSLMENSDKSIDPNIIRVNLTDSHYKENISYIYQGRAELKDRILAFFSDSTYAVMTHDNPLYVWYYDSQGNLIYAERKNQTEYPYKTYKYTPSGKLVNMSLRVSKGETFIYLPSGKLIAHWLGANAYDDKGNVIMTRKYYE